MPRITWMVHRSSTETNLNVTEIGQAYCVYQASSVLGSFKLIHTFTLYCIVFSFIRRTIVVRTQQNLHNSQINQISE